MALVRNFFQVIRPKSTKDPKIKLVQDSDIDSLTVSESMIQTSSRPSDDAESCALQTSTVGRAAPVPSVPAGYGTYHGTLQLALQLDYSCKI